MKTMRSRVLATALGAMTLTMLIACEVTGVGVDSSVGVGYVGGYYEPYGYDYGGWGGAYRVGPSRCCEHRDDHGHDGRGGHDGGGHEAGGHDGHAGRAPAYRPAPAGRPAPSIPGRSRQH
jgi:hypothetical protein